MKGEFRILSTTAILGYGFPEESFFRGMERRPHLIAADAGSTDPGPYYLGSGKSFTDRSCVKRDLRYMLTAGVRNGIPVVVGSCGGSGARNHLDWCLDIVREIAREEGLSFRMGVIPADIDEKVLMEAVRAGETEPLGPLPALTEETVKASAPVVAQMGVEPFIEAFKKGCTVIMAGRAYDPAVFAALPIHTGYDKALSLHLGKILECAAIAADPGSGSDAVLGILEEDSFTLEALSDTRKFTRVSVAAHSLYEKSDPYHLPGPGGSLDLTGTVFEEIGNGKVRVRGTAYRPTEEYMIKLEGARVAGYRALSIAGIRDDILIAAIDTTLEAVAERVKGILKRENVSGKTIFHIYGKNAVMGDLEPVPKAAGHEIGLVLEAIAPTQAEADTICSITRSTLLHYGYPGRISTAGNLAFPFSPSDMQGGAVYEFSIYHLMKAAGKRLFPVSIEEVRS